MNVIKVKPIKSSLTLAATVLLLGVAPVEAALHFDIDTINTTLDASHPSFTSTFDITGSGLGKGYNPATMTIKSATATFVLYDLPNILGGGSETVTVNLGGSDFDSSGSFSGLIQLGGGVTGNLLIDLDTDGVLNYSVNRGTGSFNLVSAELDAVSGPRSVPDSGMTVTLLGFSLIGLGMFKRR